MKLREGNVFSRVCPSVSNSVHASGGRGGPISPLPMMHWTSLYRAPWPHPSPDMEPHFTGTPTPC